MLKTLRSSVKRSEPSAIEDHTDGSNRSFVPPEIERKLPRLYRETKLAPLDLKFDMVREEEYTVNLMKAHRRALKCQVLHASSKARASVLFVVRRPGCVMCQEQGLDLCNLLEEFPEQSVAAFACVKEIHVDDEGLTKLYNDYFHFPFFRDTNMRVYQALGDKRVNVAKGLLKYPFLKKRWEKKGLRGTVFGEGEGLFLGGVMVFNRSGEVQYAYQEKFGLELPLDEIRDAIHDVINV